MYLATRDWNLPRHLPPKVVQKFIAILALKSLLAFLTAMKLKIDLTNGQAK